MKLWIALLALSLAGCGTMSATRQLYTGPAPLDAAPPSSADYDSAKAAAQTDRTTNPKAPKYATRKEIEEFLHEGEALAVARCEAWFNDVAAQEALMTLGLQQYNALNNAAIAAVGLFVPHAATAAATAAALGIVGGAVNDTAGPPIKALLAGSTYALRDGTLDSMMVFIGEIEKTIDTVPFQIAQIQLHRLEELCRPGAVQNMVNQAMAITQAVPIEAKNEKEKKTGITVRGVQREARGAK